MGLKWIHLTQNTVQALALVDIAMNHPVSCLAGNFLLSNC
jgi:hypothetical protein